MDFVDSLGLTNAEEIRSILKLSSQESSASLPRLGIMTKKAASVRRPGVHLTPGAELMQVMPSKIFATQSMPITAIVSKTIYVRALLTKTLLMKTLLESVHLVKTATTKLPSCTMKNLPARRPGKIGIISATRMSPLKRNRRSVTKSTRTTTRLLS